MEKGKFEDAKRIQERIGHLKELMDAISKAKERIEKRRERPDYINALALDLGTLILQVYEAKGSEFVFDDFISMIKEQCRDEILKREEEFRQL